LSVGIIIQILGKLLKYKPCLKYISLIIEEEEEKDILNKTSGHTSEYKPEVNGDKYLRIEGSTDFVTFSKVRKIYPH